MRCRAPAPDTVPVSITGRSALCQSGDGVGGLRRTAAQKRLTAVPREGDAGHRSESEAKRDGRATLLRPPVIRFFATHRGLSF